MTTPETANGQASDPLRRPELERTDPLRNIFNAFRQSDGRGVDAAFLRGLARGLDPAQDAPSETGDWAPGPVWSNVADSVRAGYDVINRQLEEGRAAASEFAAAGNSAGAGSVPELVNRLMRTYSDMGAVWVDLVLAALDRDQRAAPGPVAPVAAAASPGVAVDLTASQPVRARARLYRAPVGALSALALRATGAKVPDLTGIRIDPGPLVVLDIPAGTPAGTYHGILLEEGADEPVGSVSVSVSVTVLVPGAG